MSFSPCLILSPSPLSPIPFHQSHISNYASSLPCTFSLVQHNASCTYSINISVYIQSSLTFPLFRKPFFPVSFFFTSASFFPFHNTFHLNPVFPSVILLSTPPLFVSPQSPFFFLSSLTFGLLYTLHPSLSFSPVLLHLSLTPSFPGRCDYYTSREILVSYIYSIILQKNSSLLRAVNAR